METLSPSLQQTALLRDIHEIPPLPWWPLAPGWWLVALALIAAGLLLWRWRAPLSVRIPLPGLTLGTWRWEAAAALRDLRRRVARRQDPRALLGEFSELLRRIAMARLGREACAGLQGEAWLAWLTQHDPRGFSWSERARVLILGPYAPPEHQPEAGTAQDLLHLIDAALAWVTVADARGRWWRWRPWNGSPRAPGRSARPGPIR
ncbi:hypothetical protein CKO25_10330 [Thiocapsa imhoffii]|uniref:DUF4381 domain-containing protein n=1 Tax=Thiocapsa imhoffii TaxID=382777 RepID=A0A9X0WIC0_9GAMM|nr:DUF4381 domain-containing protein [Thiocapsa imhoffii]MBK1645041.1 hypothetical protein [Thiocapsa imhoffii]